MMGWTGPKTVENRSVRLWVIKKKTFPPTPSFWFDTKSLLLSSRGGCVISLKFSHSGFEVAFIKKLAERPGFFWISIFFPPRGQPSFTGSTGISGSKERAQVFIWPQQHRDLGKTLHVLCNAYTVRCLRTTVLDDLVSLIVHKDWKKREADLLLHMTCV